MRTNPKSKEVGPKKKEKKEIEPISGKVNGGDQKNIGQMSGKVNEGDEKKKNWTYSLESYNEGEEANKRNSPS